MTTGPVIDALKLTRGYLGSGSDSYSAGLYCTVSKTTLSNLEICSNRVAVGCGGRYGIALKLMSSDNLVTDCYFHDNTNSTAGDAYLQTVQISGDRNLVRNCLFVRNSAQEEAGLRLTGSNAKGQGAIVNCAFTGNTVRTGAILTVGRNPGAPVVNVLIANNHSESGYNASNYLAWLGGNSADANKGYFVNITVAENYDTTPPSPENPGVYLYGESGVNGARQSFVMNAVFKNNHGIADGGVTNAGTGWIVYSLADDALPNIGTLQSNLTGSAVFRFGSYELMYGSPGVNSGGYVLSSSRGGKSFKYLDVNRNNSYDICLDVIVWAEAGFTFNPPLSGSDFDIVATNALGSWDANGLYREGNSRIIGGTIDMGAYESKPPSGTVVYFK